MQNNKEMDYVSKLNKGNMFKQYFNKLVENIINTLMGYIETYVTLMKSDDNTPQEASEYLEQINKYSKQVAMYKDMKKHMSNLSDIEAYTMSTIQTDSNGNPLVTSEISELIRKKFNLG